MIRSILLVLLLSTPALAQSDNVVTAPPMHESMPAPTGVSAWPAADSIKPGTRLIITTQTYSVAPYTCHLRSLEPDRIVCKNGRRAQPVIFERNTVSTILQPHTRWGHPLTIGLAVTSLAMLGGGIGCAYAGGGSGCSYLIIGGLMGGLAEGIASYVMYGIDLIRGPATPTPLYIAPAPFVAAP